MGLFFIVNYFCFCKELFFGIHLKFSYNFTWATYPFFLSFYPTFLLYSAPYSRINFNFRFLLKNFKKYQMSKFTLLPHFLLLTSLLAIIPLTSSTQCLGLALQGGADKGAYQAGALAALIKYTNPGEAQYDAVSGVSIGAVNSAWISQFPKGQEQPMVDQLIDFWVNLKPSDIYKEWLGGLVQGMLMEPSLYNTKPGKEYLKTRLANVPQRYLSVGTTNLDHATYRSFDNFQTDMSVDSLVEVVLASMALPGLFPYQVIDDVAYTDGGAIMSVDVESVISKCREITGGDDSSIYIDVVLLTAVDYKAENASQYHTIRILQRTLELMAYHSAVTGLVQAKEDFPNVHWRYLVQPSVALPDSLEPISFNHNDIEKMIQQGEIDGEKSIKKGAGVEFERYIEEAVKKIGRGRNKRRRSESMMGQYMKELTNFVKEKLQGKREIRW